MKTYELKSKFMPAGDQEQAIKKLTSGLESGQKDQVLLGATGTGKTFTIANVIKNTNRSVLVLSHNKTLAAQLYSELKEFFPNNRVEYFISNFDYYRPEAYMPSTDTYIDKTSKSNMDIEALRMSATVSLLSGEPVIVVASVAAIYGHRPPEQYADLYIEIEVGMQIKRSDLLYKLVSRGYDRNNIDKRPNTFSVKGDVIEVVLAYEMDAIVRIEMFGDEVERISWMSQETREITSTPKRSFIFPGDFYITDHEDHVRMVASIKKELTSRLAYFEKENKLLEKQRLEHRVTQDMEAILEFGRAPGMENYSRHLEDRKPGERPNTMFDYLMYNSNKRKTRPLVIIDESHIMVPQLRAMYEGDKARKTNLVEYGFRLPSALDNRPIKFDEWNSYDTDKIFVSATPAEYEINLTNGEVVSQIIRPTGLLDPIIEVEPTAFQVDKIFDLIQKQKKKGERTLVLTTTKRMAEEFSKYMQTRNEKIAYMHSDHKTFERQEIIRKLRLGVIDTIVGINLLREGLDIPEVSLICILDADQESFFRSETSLIQIIGRAARNANGKVVMFADRISKAMKYAIDETARRRKIQEEHNKKHGITPKTIVKSIAEPMQGQGWSQTDVLKFKTKKNKDKEEMIRSLRASMLRASRKMDFERAMELRDLIIELEGE